MKKTIFITLFIAVHIGFFFLQIQMHMMSVRETFALQKSEKMLAQLRQKEQELSNQLHTLQSKQHAKEYAEQADLKPVKLSQINRLAHE